MITDYRIARAGPISHVDDSSMPEERWPKASANCYTYTVYFQRDLRCQMEWLTLLTADAEQKRLIELRRTERDLRIARQAEISRAARERQIALSGIWKLKWSFSVRLTPTR